MNSSSLSLITPGVTGITVTTGGLVMAGQASLLPWLALAATMLFTATLALRTVLRRQKRLALEK